MYIGSIDKWKQNKWPTNEVRQNAIYGGLYIGQV